MPDRSAVFWFIGKAVFTLGALWLLSRLVEVDAVAEAARNANPVWAGLALLLLPLNVGLEAYRWHRLVRRLAPSVTLGASLRAVLGGYPLGLLTPARVGEYAGRAALLREVPAGEATALTLGEKMATLTVILVAGLVALPSFLVAHAPPSPLWPAVVVLCGLWTGTLLLAVLHPSGTHRVLGALLPFRPVRQALSAFEAIPPREARILLALSAVRYAVFAGQFVLLVLAFAPGASVAGCATGVALVLFAKSAIHSVTLGDLGIREGAAVFFLGAYGVPEAAALSAALGVFAINLLLPALAGLPLLLRLRQTRPHPHLA